MKEDQQKNAANQAWKHKKGYGSTFFLLVVAMGGLVAVINKSNSHRTIDTSPVGNNLIRSKPGKSSSMYEDTCLRNDLTKEELVTTVSFLQDEYVVPYLKTLGKKEFMDSIVVTPASVPSGVQVLDPNDDSSLSISSKKCANLDFDLLKIYPMMEQFVTNQKIFLLLSRVHFRHLVTIFIAIRKRLPVMYPIL